MMHLQQCWSRTKRMNPQTPYSYSKILIIHIVWIVFANAQCVRVCYDLVTPNDHEWHFTCTACQFCGITLPGRLLDKILWSTIPFVQSGSPFWGSADSPSCPKCSVSHLCWSHPAVSCRCIQITISNSHDQLHHDHGCWDKTVSFNIRKMTHSSFDMIIFNQRPHSHRVRQLMSQTLCRTSYMAPCDTSIIRYISLWESPRLGRRTIISVMTGRVLVSVHATVGQLIFLVISMQQ